MHRITSYNVCYTKLLRPVWLYCQYGGYKFLYLSPERLQQTMVRERINQLDVNLIAIDEAHRNNFV